MTFSSQSYSRITGEDEDAQEKAFTSQLTIRPVEVRRRRWWPWVLHGALIGLYTIVFLTWAVSLRRSRSFQFNKCASKQSMYSPAHEAVHYETVRFNGSLDFPSPYAGPPSPAIDAAWDRITTNNALWTIRLSDDDLERIHKAGRPSNVRYRPEDGGGNMGSIEVFHQLHCLNMLRKYTYPKEYPELQKLWTTRPKFIRSHLDHCVEMIRQNLMCASDIGVISYDWISGWDKPFPDFNTYHKCRNFNSILDWAERHRVHVPPTHIQRLGDKIDLPDAPN
ncbi:hypothetical protein NLJ89_g5193 [Agrocybe chaxingu]|uniref:Tat pathway signal sequence n=1 Tax=Agrocybe chaxingu TaxID=84603 RepID=A0A9W8K1K8_9AGAR|nr:hypothetical protein NLJ89_g5193 [Agrocybe chaxingu]